MGYFLFVDESGQDRCKAEYEVLAGVAIEDKDLWNFIQQLHAAEEEYFGCRVTDGALELKARKLLKRKTFRLAAQMSALDSDERRELAASCIAKGGIGQPTRRELTALGQAKIAFVENVLEMCARFRVKAFASIVDREAEKPESNFLRKDYAYLFERFFYFLDDRPNDVMGMVVFDELEKSQCHLLINQMEAYFLRTRPGRMRAAKVVPEPFFVHSDLTSLIQVADLVAYIISWGVRFNGMPRPCREELSDLARQVCALRHKAVMEKMGREDFEVWSFAVIDDLRPRNGIGE